MLSFLEGLGDGGWSGEGLRVLISRGMSPEILNKSHQTTLFYSSTEGSRRAAECLLALAREKTRGENVRKCKLPSSISYIPRTCLRPHKPTEI